MNNKFETIFTKAKELKLDPQKRESVRQSLKIYMRQNPLPTETLKHSVWQYYRSYPLVSVACAVILLFGGTALASQRALPGDVLYPVKIANERVESAFAIGPKATALVEVDQAAARLEEAEQLSIVTPLATSTQTQLQTDFDAHVGAVSAGIAALKKSGDYSDATNVEATLQTIISKHHRGFLTITATSTATSSMSATSTLEVNIKYIHTHPTPHTPPVASSTSNNGTPVVTIPASVPVSTPSL